MAKAPDKIRFKDATYTRVDLTPPIKIRFRGATYVLAGANYDAYQQAFESDWKKIKNAFNNLMDKIGAAVTGGEFNDAHRNFADLKKALVKGGELFEALSMLANSVGGLESLAEMEGVGKKKAPETKPEEAEKQG